MVHFEESDRESWLAFLNTLSGRKGLEKLRETERPEVRESGQPHEMQFDLGKQRGFDYAMSRIEGLSRMPVKKERVTADRPTLEDTRPEHPHSVTLKRE